MQVKKLTLLLIVTVVSGALGGLLAGLGEGVHPAAAQTPASENRVVTAERFVLTGPSARGGAALFKDQGGPGFMLGRDGSPSYAKLYLYGRGQNPAFILVDGNGAIRLSYGLDPEGRPFLQMLDELQRVRAALFTDAGGSARLHLFQADGKLLWGKP